MLRGWGGQAVAGWPLAGCGEPSLQTVDMLARMQLEARAIGCGIEVVDPPAELVELIDLAGLTRVLPVTVDAGGSALEVSGKVEGREEVGVEEVVVPDDPVP